MQSLKDVRKGMAGLTVLRAEVDRLSSAGAPAASSSRVIRRDVQAHQGGTWAARASLGHDFDGATFTHIGGIPVDEAAGIELLVRGLQVLHDDDAALLAADVPLFDTLHAALRLPT